MAETVKFKGGKEVVERINGGGGEDFKTVLAALFTWEMLCPAAVSMARSSCGGRSAVHCLFSRALGGPRCAGATPLRSPRVSKQLGKDAFV